MLLFPIKNFHFVNKTRIEINTLNKNYQKKLPQNNVIIDFEGKKNQIP